MKTIISKIFYILKSLFLKLSVIVTLRLGKDKVENGQKSGVEEHQKGDTLDD